MPPTVTYIQVFNPFNKSVFCSPELRNQMPKYYLSRHRFRKVINTTIIVIMLVLSFRNFAGEDELL
ncbi:hypothetical protein CF168_19035 [Shewanella bicestrii]|uniref:Uncharacterized protein n=1 Tax=Shewanella bicestrii TaxID=2018305 RepID=A0A220URH7_9GAMM|nr:hypothetical protein CF168_19035 [Shewanella bicestrii]